MGFFRYILKITSIKKPILRFSVFEFEKIFKIDKKIYFSRNLFNSSKFSFFAGILFFLFKYIKKFFRGDLMKEFSIPMKKNYYRPVIELYNLPTLIDTGSVIPVFSIFPTTLEKYFDINLILDNYSIESFGGEERGSVYSIKNFKIGELIFNNFEVFVPYRPKLQFPFLLSATLFFGINYEIDNINNNFIVKMNDEQNFEIDFKIKEIRGKLYPQIDGVLIQDIDSFLVDFWIR